MLPRVLLILTLMLMINFVSHSEIYAPTLLPGFYLQSAINEKVYYTKKVKQIAVIKNISPSFLLSIWEEESRQKGWVKKGTSGELSPFQIMPSTAKYYNCNDNWSSSLIRSGLCSAKIISRFNCRNYLRKAAKYNTGRCYRVNQYARNVYKRMQN